MTLRKLARLIPLAVFFVVFFAYLSTVTPYLSHNDAFSYIHAADRWLRIGGEAAAWSKPGWTALLALLFSFDASAATDPLKLVWIVKVTTLLFAAAAAVGMYLLAKKLHASTAFALLATALFAANPIIWRWSQSGMTDMPALAFMLFSFLFYLRFYQARRLADLAIAGGFTGLAMLIRLPSIVILAPQIVGMFFIAYEEPGQPLRKRARTFLKLSFLACAFSAALPVLVYGAPWTYTDKGPQILSTSWSNFMGTAKWYVFRDAGWMWFLLAWVGLGIGLVQRKSRPAAAMLISAIAGSVLYIADWYDKTGGDTDRYVIAAIPMTILGLGFLWRSDRKRLVSGSLTLLAAAYVGGVALGLRSPGTRLASALAAEKLVLFPYLQASSVAATEQDRVLELLDAQAKGRILPDDLALLVPISDWAVTPFFFDVAGKHGRRIVWVESLSETAWRAKLSSLANVDLVYVHPQLNVEPFRAALKADGYAPVADIFGAALFKKE